MSAASASRSVESNRLSTCQLGNWQRCPSLRERSWASPELRKKFFEMYTDRDAGQAALIELQTQLSQVLFGTVGSDVPK